jgi:hypothetical protein
MSDFSADGYAADRLHLSGPKSDRSCGQIFGGRDSVAIDKDFH